MLDSGTVVEIDVFLDLGFPFADRRLVDGHLDLFVR